MILIFDMAVQFDLIAGISGDTTFGSVQYGYT